MSASQTDPKLLRSHPDDARRVIFMTAGALTAKIEAGGSVAGTA